MKRVGAIKSNTNGSGGLGSGLDFACGAPSSPQTTFSDVRVIEVPSLKYPIPLSLYTDPPLCEVTLEEFEELALGRLEGATHQHTVL